MFSKMTNDKVLVELVPEDESMKKTASGLYLAGSTENDRYKQAYVVVTGPDSKVVKKDDRIMFDIVSGKEIQDSEGNKFYLLREDAVIGIM